MANDEFLPVSLRDYVPAAFHQHCVRPRGVNIKYTESSPDCFEFTYTLVWRGRTLPEQLPEIAGLLGATSSYRSEKSTTGGDIPSPATVGTFGTVLMDETQPFYPTTVAISSDSNYTLSSSFSVDNKEKSKGKKEEKKPKKEAKENKEKDGLQKFKIDLYKNFSCSRYYFDALDLKKKNGKKEKTPVISVHKPETSCSSATSYLKVPGGVKSRTKSRKKAARRRTKQLKTPALSFSTIDCWPVARLLPVKEMREREEKEERSVLMRTVAAKLTPKKPLSFGCRTAIPKTDDFTVWKDKKEDKNQKILLQVKLRKPQAMGSLQIEGFFRPDVVLCDAVDDLLAKSQHRLILKTYQVEERIFYGHPAARRPLSHLEFFTGILGQLKEDDGTVCLTVDMRKDEHQLVKKFSCH